MSRFDAADVRLGERYERERAQARTVLAAARAPRRIALGERLSLVFENETTIRAAAEETLRAERVTDADAAARDIAAFSNAVPAQGELAAVLYVESDDPVALATSIAELHGVERAVALEIDGERAPGEPLEADAAGAAALHLTFRLSDSQRRAWLSSSEVAVSVDHPACSVRTLLSTEQRSAIASDL